MDRPWENAGSQTTANLQRAPGFCWLQDFHYQTNEHLFQCRLAVELLLLLKLPPKYHTFHKTCAAVAGSKELSAFQPLCPRFGHPQTECSMFSDSSAPEKSLFSSIHEPCQRWYKVSPTWAMIRERAVIPWELNSGSLNVTKRQELQQPRKGSLCGREQSAPKGVSREGSHPAYASKRKEGRKRPLLPFVFLLLPQSTLPSGKHPCLQFNS